VLVTTRIDDITSAGAADIADVDVVRDAESAICTRWKSHVYTPNSDDESEADSDVQGDQGASDRNPFATNSGLSPWDDLGEAFERDAANISKIFPLSSVILKLEIIGVQQTN
jgi:hypothetical protein